MCVMCSETTTDKVIEYLVRMYQAYVGTKPDQYGARTKLIDQTALLYRTTCGEHKRAVMTLASYLRYWTALAENEPTTSLLCSVGWAAVCPSCVAKRKGLWTAIECPLALPCNSLTQICTLPEIRQFEVREQMIILQPYVRRIVGSELRKVGHELYSYQPNRPALIKGDNVPQNPIFGSP